MRSGTKRSVFPNCSGVKALVNHAHGYRLRVGNFRVLFELDGTIRLIRIEEVRKRDDRAYRDPEDQGT
jgi:mRNA interferase RelE/StbE